MKIAFLGTNGWFDINNHQTICTLIETKKYYIILDAGFGIAKANKYLKKDKPVFLFISHLHLDHICGLHVLNMLNVKNELTIFVAQQSKTDLLKFMGHPFTNSISENSYPIKVVGLEEGDYDYPINFTCRKLHHVDNDFGFRFNLENKIIAYCTDTSICKNDELLAQTADILIHECSCRPGHDDYNWGHSAPETVANMAKKVNVKKLILTHLSPNHYPTSASRKMAARIAKKIFKNTIIAQEDATLKI